MKFKLAFLAAVSVAALSVGSEAAMAQSGMEFKPYVSVFAGASFLGDVNTIYFGTATHYSVKTNTGYLLGGAVGVQLNDHLRTEIELSHSAWSANSEQHTQDGVWRPARDASGPISATYLLGNAWIDIPTNSAFTPYVGGGLGIGWATADVSFHGQDYGYGPGNSGFAFQLGGGVKFDVSDRLTLDIGYRFKDLSGINFADRDGGGVYTGATLASHNVQVGLTYKF